MLVKGAPGEKTSPGCIPQNKQRCQAICPSLTSGYPAFPLSLSQRHHYHSNPITRPSWAQRAAFWQLDGPLLATGESQPSLRISAFGFSRKWCNKWFCWRNASPHYGFRGWSTACKNFCDKPLPTPSTFFNSLWPSDTIWQHKSGSTLAQVMACCLTAQSHYLKQCWLIISKVKWHSSECNFRRDASAISHWI